MTQKIRVLMVEADEPDAQLMAETLQRGDYQVQHRCVQTSETFRTALATDEWDIVLSAFNLPNFNAFQVLEILQEALLDTPVIVVSGSASEDMAISIMRAGARDFIRKGNLEQLAPAVLREVQQAAVRSARYTAEVRLRLSESRFKSIFESNVIGVFFADIHGHIFDANAAFLDMLGYDQEDLHAGRLNWITLTPPEWQYHNAAVATGLVSASKKLSGYEKQYFHKQGHRIDVLLSTRAVEGMQKECVCCVLDITERKKKEAAEKASLRKTHFLSDMTHELRSPLNNILLASDMTLEEMLGPLTPKQREYSSLIRNNASHLLAIINDILDIARIEAGKNMLHPEDVALQPMINEAINLVLPEAESERQHLFVNFSENLPEHIHCDKRRIKQAVCNLLSNAHKFAPENTNIFVTCRAGIGDEIVIAVRDEGPGIPESEIECILRPFERGGASEDGKRGTGLGLPITAKIAELHLGRLEISSAPDRGSEFRLIIRSLPSSSEPSDDFPDSQQLVRHRIIAEERL